MKRDAQREGHAGGSEPASSGSVPAVPPAAAEVLAAVSELVGQVAAGLAGTGPSGLLAVVEQARAVSGWLASVELEAISRLLREQVREGREESEQLARAGRCPPEAVKSAGATGEGWGWDWTVAEIACAARLSARQADDRVGLACLLRDLPQVHVLLRVGRLDEYRARVIAEILSMSSLSPHDEAWGPLVDLVCSKAPDRTHTQIRSHLHRQLLKVDPEARARRRQKAVAEREVRWWAEPEGMAVLQARISGETAAIIDTALNAMADAARDHSGAGGDVGGAVGGTQTHQQRRADAFGEVFRSLLEGRSLRLVPAGGGQTGPGQPKTRQPAAQPEDQSADAQAGTTEAGTPEAAGSAPPGQAFGSDPSGAWVPVWWEPPELPTRKGRRPHLIVTVSDRTLAGIDDLPAELSGYGPIPADIARKLAQQAGSYTVLPQRRTRRPGPPGSGPPDVAPGSAGGASVGAPDGAARCTAASCGTDRYNPDQALIEAVIASYPTCQAPGCTRPATHCDLDHVIPYSHGGRTCIHNPGRCADATTA